MGMNNQLKLLIYIAFVVVIFLFLQDRFEIFDVSLISDRKENVSEENPYLEEDPNVQAEVSIENDSEKYIEISKKEGGYVKVTVDVSDSDEERKLGLSGRRYLGDYEGMLFVFEENTNVSFWMKDMYFPIDIIFVDGSGFITHIHDNAQPCESVNNCPSIGSNGWYRYVLEVNAGFCDRNGIEEGNSLQFYLD